MLYAISQYQMDIMLLLRQPNIDQTFWSCLTGSKTREYLIASMVILPTSIRPAENSRYVRIADRVILYSLFNAVSLTTPIASANDPAICQ